MEELWNCFSDGNELEFQQNVQEDSNSGEDLMAISVQAIHGTEGSKTIRLKGNLGGKDMFMLINSGSSHSFIDEQTAKGLLGWQILSNPVQVQVANGETLRCTHQLPKQLWGIQGHSFYTTFKILPLQRYDVILGMDWLGANSPMVIHWIDCWVSFTQNNQLIKLQGISPTPQLGPPVSCSQVQAMEKADSILYMIQLQPATSSSSASESPSLPQELLDIINQYSDVFAPPDDLPPCRHGDHYIPLLEGTQPFCLWPYRYNPAQKTEIENQIKDMLSKGWIQPSSSPFSLPALLVRKKIGDWRLCVDYRRLNAQTVKNKYPLPIIDELLDELCGASWFTSLDLCSGFHQIRMQQGEEYKTAFQTHNGHFNYCVMPYGVTGGLATFQAIMNVILAPLLRKFVSLHRRHTHL
jgi:hypothetical protein